MQPTPTMVDELSCQLFGSQAWATLPTFLMWQLLASLAITKSHQIHNGTAFPSATYTLNSHYNVYPEPLTSQGMVTSIQLGRKYVLSQVGWNCSGGRGGSLSPLLSL